MLLSLPKFSSLVVIAAVSSLSSCASIHSIETSNLARSDGLSYYMPKKDILISTKLKANGSVDAITIGVTDAYPDSTAKYYLRHGRNGFGKSTTDVSITESGLLSTAKSTNVSNVAEILNNLGSASGSLSAFAAAQAQGSSGAGCAAGATHSKSFPVTTEKETLCGLTIAIEKLGVGNGNIAHTRTVNDYSPGIYYRQNQPYKVSVTGKGHESVKIVFSPSRSDTYFLPIAKTFFADSEATFNIVDGVPQKYVQSTESEILSLVKIPAKVIASYFGAVGTVFDSFKTSEGKEASALEQSLKLELAARKYERCLAAINADDEDKIKELGCS